MSTLSQPLLINGFIDTNKPVLENLNNLCTASLSWLTYDISTGKWCVVINKTGTSIASFDDSNIIGSINVSGTGVNELYNSVSIEFPHADLRDQKDYIDLSIPSADRFENEVDNNLNIQTDLINDPITAQYLASIELKQNRIDKVIEFRTDYSKIGLKAGDLIDVTNSIYNYTNKIFRIIKIEEDDGDTLSLSITALEYDSNVYSTSGLSRNERTKRTGILIKTMNSAVTASEESNFSSNMLNMLLPLAGTGLLNLLFNKNPLTKKLEAVMAGPLTVVKSESLSGPNIVCEGQSVTFTVSVCTISPCVDYSTVKLPYRITGISGFDIDVPLTGEITLDSTGNGSLDVVVQVESPGGEPDEVMTFTCGGQSKSVTIKEAQTITYSTSSPSSITEGNSVTVTLITSGIPNGTEIPYVIRGTASDRIDIPDMGNVTINNNSASLTIQVTDDTVYTGTQYIEVVFNQDIEKACGDIDNIAVISIRDNDTAPPTNTNCNPVLVPVFWCPVYDGATGEVIGLDVLKSASFCSPVPGGPTAVVPTAVSVTRGNPSTITVTATATVDANTNKGGQEYLVQTSFNSIAPYGSVSGTTVKLVGF